MAYRRMSFWEHVKEYWGKFISQPKSRLIAGAVILAGVGYVVFGGAYGREYHKQVNEELSIAVKLCENSRGFVMRNFNSLKIGNTVLKEVRVNGEKREFEVISHPEIVVTATGFTTTLGERKDQQIYCNFEDPRSGKNFYYRYESGRWEDSVRLK